MYPILILQNIVNVSSCFKHPALEVSKELPEPEEIKRWLGEPVRTAIVPTKVFLTNKKGWNYIMFKTTHALNGS